MYSFFFISFLKNIDCFRVYPLELIVLVMLWFKPSKMEVSNLYGKEQFPMSSEQL